MKKSGIPKSLSVNRNVLSTYFYLCITWKYIHCKWINICIFIWLHGTWADFKWTPHFMVEMSEFGMNQVCFVKHNWSTSSTSLKSGSNAPPSVQILLHIVPLSRDLTKVATRLFSPCVWIWNIIGGIWCVLMCFDLNYLGKASPSFGQKSKIAQLPCSWNLPHVCMLTTLMTDVQIFF